MKAVTLIEDDLRGFLESYEIITPKDIELINKQYQTLCSIASKEEEQVYIEHYDNEGYFPPFVAQAICDVLD